MSIISRQAVEVLAMHHHVQRQRQAGRADGGGEARLPRMRAREAGDAIAVVRLVILEAELDMLQPGLGEASISRSPPSVPEVIRLL